jgi:uncharacterized protein YprB with RNaseH-like and TPR domain
MDLRAKLARLRGSLAPAAGSQLMAAEPERVEYDQPPSELWSLPPLAADDAAPPWPAISGDKSERIAKLRSMIAEVAARQRTQPSAPMPAKAAAAPNLSDIGSAVLAFPRPPRGSPRPTWPSQETPHGRLYFCERYLEPHHHHGHTPVLAGARCRPGTLATLLRDGALHDLDISRALYLDTETTGLAGGTGTVAFLVGLARFEGDSFCLEQLIVPELGGETPVLARLAERIAAASCVVSYNGKSFDWPLLRNRFVLARLPVPELPAHIDLLHISRSLWKSRMESLRLVDVERAIMRFERIDDLPGSEIPARYFEYLRGAGSERLAPVLEHNQNDIIALAALLGHVVARFEAPEPHADSLAFARMAWRARDLDRARALAAAALADSADAHARDLEAQRAQLDARLFSAELARQLGDVDDAIAHYQRALSLRASEEQHALVHCALAKLYEHDRRDLSRALAHARHTEACEGPHAHGRRLGRLYRRVLREAS